MALWLARAGSRGQYEDDFLDEKKICLTWSKLPRDLTSVETRDEVKHALREAHPEAKDGRINQNAAQLWTFLKRMAVGDWIATPSKRGPFIHFGEIKSPAKYDPSQPDYYRHYRTIDWFATEVPKSNFDQDLLYSMGAFSTFCAIKRNDAERRIRAMRDNNWAPSKTVLSNTSSTSPAEEDDDSETSDLDALINLESASREAIAAQILAKFKGHGLEALVAAVLEAKGYTVYQHDRGADHGIDLLAAQGALGFDHPKICVQVKSQQGPVDRPTLDQLLGTMSNVDADHGLLVCWGGFKSSVMREAPKLFFRVRLWDRDRLIDELLDVYEHLSDEIQAELPLKRIWTLAAVDDADSEGGD